MSFLAEQGLDPPFPSQTSANSYLLQLRKIRRYQGLQALEKLGKRLMVEYAMHFLSVVINTFFPYWSPMQHERKSECLKAVHCSETVTNPSIEAASSASLPL